TESSVVPSLGELRAMRDLFQRAVDETEALRAGRALDTLPRPYDPRLMNEICERGGCGSAYYRHFDTYDGYRTVGCKYCPCPAPLLRAVECHECGGREVEQMGHFWLIEHRGSCSRRASP